jgi:D-alanyl-D-alanine carboxypeptidase
MPSSVSIAVRVVTRACALTLLVGFCGLSRPVLAGPALLFDSNDGKVLYAEDQDDVWYPASLTKMMTAYLTFEALKQGKITLDTKLTQSELSHSQPPSKIGMPIGAQMDVELALQSLIIKSANDVAVMLAEGISGTQEDFVTRMNATAKRLGM